MHHPKNDGISVRNCLPVPVQSPSEAFFGKSSGPVADWNTMPQTHSKVEGPLRQQPCSLGVTWSRNIAEVVTENSLHEAHSPEWVDHSCPSSKQVDQGLGSSPLERQVKKLCG